MDEAAAASPPPADQMNAATAALRARSASHSATASAIISPEASPRGSEGTRGTGRAKADRATACRDSSTPWLARMRAGRGCDIVVHGEAAGDQAHGRRGYATDRADAAAQRRGGPAWCAHASKRRRPGRSWTRVIMRRHLDYGVMRLHGIVKALGGTVRLRCHAAARDCQGAGWHGPLTVGRAPWTRRTFPDGS